MNRVAEGTPSWAEAQLPDLDAGKRFYARLFGWTFPAHATADGHLSAYLADQRVAALTALPDRRGQAAWIVYFTARDTAEIAARISAKGGVTLGSSTVATGPDHALTAKAPDGAVFGVLSAEERGFTVTGQPGTYCWTEVYTQDKNNVDPFYQEVFGFTARQTDDGTGSDLVAWAVDGTGVASRAHIGNHFPTELHGHVLACFAVDNCDQSTEKLLTLGGKVTVAPRDSRHGRFSITTDDQGTRFAMVDLHTRLPKPKN